MGGKTNNLFRATVDPVRKPDGVIKPGERAYQFTLLLGHCVFETAWFYGDDEIIEGKREEILTALGDAVDEIEVRYAPIRPQDQKST